MTARRGRPRSKNPLEQVAIRLPKAMIKYFRERRGVSVEIRERLTKTLVEDFLDEKQGAKP